MNAKKVLLLGIICVFLAGCNNGKPLEMKGEEISTEERDTRREELTGEESRNGLTEGQDTRREELTGEESRNGLTEEWDIQREELTGEESRNGLTEGQDTRREEPVSEESRSGLTEERDTQREELTGEESRSNSAQGTGSIGARLEGCYDDPNNPVKDQNYDVGQPIYE